MQHGAGPIDLDGRNVDALAFECLAQNIEKWPSHFTETNYHYEFLVCQRSLLPVFCENETPRDPMGPLSNVITEHRI
jgi:hypothetical protein